MKTIATHKSKHRMYKTHQVVKNENYVNHFLGKTSYVVMKSGHTYRVSIKSQHFGNYSMSI